LKELSVRECDLALAGDGWVEWRFWGLSSVSDDCGSSISSSSMMLPSSSSCIPCFFKRCSYFRSFSTKSTSVFLFLLLGGGGARYSHWTSFRAQFEQGRPLSHFTLRLWQMRQEYLASNPSPCAASSLIFRLDARPVIWALNCPNSEMQ